MANIQIRAGQKDTLTFSGLDQNGQPYAAWTLVWPPVASDPSALVVDGDGGYHVTAQAEGVGKTGVTVAWSATDNNNPANPPVNHVDSYDILAAAAHLATLNDTHSIS